MEGKNKPVNYISSGAVTISVFENKREDGVLFNSFVPSKSYHDVNSGKRHANSYSIAELLDLIAACEDAVSLYRVRVSFLEQ